MGIKDAEKRRLSKRVRLIWTARGIISMLFFTLFLSLLPHFYTENVLWITQAELPFYIIGGGFALIMMYIAYTELRYWSWYYALTGEGVYIRHGILRTESVFIPYSKIQNIAVSRTLAQRIIGSARLDIETAGKGAAKNECVIPAVSDYKKLLEEISEKRGKAARVA